MVVFLVGFMGCGKSTIGNILADRADYDFVDLDVSIADEFGMSINEIFARYGEAEFRKTESRLLGGIDVLQDTVVATGGGTPCFGDNMSLMKRRGKVIYLKLSEGELFGRLLRGRARRPKIAALSDTQLMEFITESVSSRERFYSMADCIVDCDGKEFDEVIDILLGLLDVDKSEQSYRIG